MKRIFIFLICLTLVIGFGTFHEPTPAVAGPGGKGAGAGGGSGGYPKCKGPKKRIAVYRFTDGVNSQASAEIRDGLFEALQYELTQSGCFIVLVTNDDLGDAATEIGHGQSGMANEKYTPQAGSQLGAQIIVQGTLYEVAYTGGQGGGVKIPGKATGGIGGTVGINKQQAKVVLMIKMFDPETRQLLYNEKAEGMVEKQSVAVGVKNQGVKVGGKLDKETPLGDAALQAIHDAVRKIIKKMNTMPWQATVLKVEGNKVLIRGGATEGLTAGMILNVFKPGETIEDPDTGEKLQEPATQMGQVRVTQVSDQMTYCETVSGPVIKGMWVRFEPPKPAPGTPPDDE